MAKKRATLRQTSPKPSKPGVRKVALLAEAGVPADVAKVVDVYFEDNHLILVLENPEATNKNLKQLLLVFEALRNVDHVFEALNDRLESTYARKKGPIRPDARLTQLSIRRTSGKFPRKVEWAMQPWRKAETLSCRRVVLRSRDGTLLAGDQPPLRSAYSEHDYVQFARRFAEHIEAGVYASVRDMLDEPLRKRKTTEQLSKQLERWKKIPNWARKTRSGKSSFAVLLNNGASVLDAPASLDSDRFCAMLDLEFFDRFILQIVLVERDGKLRVGWYRPHREF